MKILIAYVPVLHAGYERFFLKHRDADLLLLFGEKTIVLFDWLRKDLRCLDPGRAAQSIRSWGIFKEVDFLENFGSAFLNKAALIVMPDETECHLYAEQFLSGATLLFESVKLRYDKKQTESISSVHAHEVSSAEALAIMKIALSESAKSPDWWIQVGGVLAHNGEVLLVGYNEHKPEQREALFMGDPRSNYGRGLQIELNLVDHAERVLIGEAARSRIGTEGCDLYVTTFPCPPCSRQIIRTGIKRCFFLKGYALMEESDVHMRAAGIEIFHVKM